MEFVCSHFGRKRKFWSETFEIVYLPLPVLETRLELLNNFMQKPTCSSDSRPSKLCWEIPHRSENIRAVLHSRRSTRAAGCWSILAIPFFLNKNNILHIFLCSGKPVYFLSVEKGWGAIDGAPSTFCALQKGCVHIMTGLESVVLVFN